MEHRKRFVAIVAEDLDKATGRVHLSRGDVGKAIRLLQWLDDHWETLDRLEALEGRTVLALATNGTYVQL